MKLILFDCDGTLVDSQRMICAAMQKTYADHGLVCPPDRTLLSIVGLSLDVAFRTLADGSDHPIESLSERYKLAFQNLRTVGELDSPLYPGAREMVEMLARRPDTLLGIATGKSRRGVAMLLSKHGITDRFVTIQTADTAPSKPHPGMVLEAMHETGAGAGDTVVIGDTAFDMEMAAAAGAGRIGVSWGYHPVEDLHAAGAQVVIDDFSALPVALDTVWSLQTPPRVTADA